MFLADGGGGSTSSSQNLTGNETLFIEWSAIPAALTAFRSARDRVQHKVDELNGLDFPAWAHDPVSGETATQFAERSASGADSAAQVLFQYHHMLNQVTEALEQTQRGYGLMDGDNTARMSGHE
ncbi:MAG TPA: hypothetical protein VGR06_31505 [Actinophytocola sp.]|uniref:hypothetical protein n=1 Tax=Actinophytocola sp. TaxID=1872138 RepID=UPI002E03D0F1|nr:hypothetical protein [Actinophytocola sp.]